MMPKEAEAYLWARWFEVDIDPLYGVTIGGCIIFAGEIVSKHLPHVLAAAEFTKQREEEIYLKREEIDRVRNSHTGCADQECDCEEVKKRILAVLESQLAALTVRMKETP